MKIEVGQLTCRDKSVPPQRLKLPRLAKLGASSGTRVLTLNEAESGTVFVTGQPDGSIVFDPNSPDAFPFAPVEAMLGSASVDANGAVTPIPKAWMDPITENPALGATETWEIYNFTMDAHPIHIHQVQFEVLNREAVTFGLDGSAVLTGTTLPPESWESGTKDTVIAYPGTVTRVKSRFDLPGLFVWHCHILSHEDNEMMRPMCVGPLQNCQ